MLKKLSALLSILAIMQSSLSAYVTEVDSRTNSSGDVLVVWQDDLDVGNFTLVAAILPNGGSWSTPTTIFNGGVSSLLNPKIVINSSGNAVVAWSAYNSSIGYTSLYATTLTDLSTWSSVVQISTNDEHVYDNYQVFLSENNEVTISWNSFIFDSVNQSAIRNITAAFGTWPTPTTLAP